MLADYGADVVWVEPPGGDPNRERLAVEYASYNRGKRSVTFDIRDHGERADFLHVVTTADVLVDTWAPGVAERAGVDDASLRRAAPHLVHCSITGFGPDGPHRDLPGYDAIVHAVAGSMGEQVGHRPPPIYEGLPFATIGSAYLAVIGMLAAIYRRNEDGHGRLVETSMLDGALAYLSMMWGDTDTGPVPFAAGGGRLVARTFRCADGEYLGVHTGALGAFGRLMTLLELDDVIPASETGMDIGLPLTDDQLEIVRDRIPAIFSTLPRQYWLERLTAADVCAIPELHPGEVFDEPQARHNQMVVDVLDPLLGELEQVAPALRFAGTPFEIRGGAPVAGTAAGLVFTGPRPWDVGPRAEGPDRRAPLDGVRVLDFGAYYAGPYSSRLLADLGADVIKVEPTAGDQLRGLSRPFRSAQSGKRSLAADLKHAGLDDARRALVAWADIVHHNLRPGAAERLHLGYEDAQVIKPDVIYVYAPGWGSSGPDMYRQSFAPLLSGYVGVGFEVGGAFNPPMFPLGNEDPGNGLLGAVAMLMALLHRQRAGRGQYVENPQLNATMTHVAHIARTPDGEMLNAGRVDILQRGVGALDRLYETADGWLVVVAPSDEQARVLAGALDIPLTDEDRFATWASRCDHDDALTDLLSTAFRARTTGEWLETLHGAGVAAAEPVPHNCTTFLRDPENQRTGRAAEVADATYGRVREVGTLVRVSDSAVTPHRSAPGLGEHSDEILASLGYESERIDELRREGAIR